MNGIQMLAFAGSISAALLGTLYAAAADVEPENAASPFTVAVLPTPAAASLAEAESFTDAEPLPETEPLLEAIPAGHDVSPEMLALIDANPDVIVDAETGVRLGPLTLIPSEDLVEPPAPREERRRPARRARRTAPTPLRPRLHSDPGRHVIAIARGMMARHEVIQGSCYRYISEVFERAGHEHWRTRRIVYRSGRLGPYADLGAIRAGDWLYIVNHPERTPVGTHSVIFVSWEDRARGYARVIEHSGWGSPSAGRERSYDVSRTYRVIRPTLSR